MAGTCFNNLYEDYVMSAYFANIMRELRDRTLGELKEKGITPLTGGRAELERINRELKKELLK